ncbi:MAG: prolipoprotein diacylglyceryl transferase [Eubacteriales bacterium]|nr:prolipoprotein diacylglyceryl transferase [Eubacteriales bacterium]
MKTYLFSVGGFLIPGYGLMIGIGFLIALAVGIFRAKSMKMNDEAVLDLAIIAILSGFLGAKILYVITEFSAFLEDPLSVIGSAGFVVYGGIISGVLCCMIYCKVKKLDFLEYFDLVMPEVAIAQGFGRIGCFLAGCCYGRETSSPIGVIFPEGSMAPAGVKLIPTQLFSAAGDILIAVILMVIAYKFSYSAAASRGMASGAGDRKHLLKGDIGCIYMLLYGIGRFVIEFFRDDERGAVGFLSTSQFISFFIVAFGVTLFVYNRKKK